MSASDFLGPVTISDVVAHVDTLKLWVNRLPPRIRKGLDAVRGKRTRIEVSKSGWGASIWVHQPDAAVMEYLLGIEQENSSTSEYKLIISQVHIAVEFITKDRHDAAKLQWKCEYEGRLKWKRIPWLMMVHGTGYRGTANRNLVSYSDRPSKTRPDRPCLRLELRLSRQAVTSLGLDEIANVCELNPHDIFAHCLAWYDFEPLIAKLLKKKRRMPRQKGREWHVIEERFRDPNYRGFRYRSIYRRLQFTLDDRCEHSIRTNEIPDLIPDACDWTYGPLKSLPNHIQE